MDYNIHLFLWHCKNEKIWLQEIFCLFCEARKGAQFYYSNNISYTFLSPQC